MTHLCPQCRTRPVRVPGDTCSLLCAQEWEERPAAVQLDLFDSAFDTVLTLASDKNNSNYERK